MRGAMPRICIECGSSMALKTISRVFKVNGKEIEIQGIEAYVCEECGEEVYTSTEAKMVERVVAAVKENEPEEKAVYNAYTVLVR